MDETCIKVKGKWAYLCRAVDSRGDTVEFHLSQTRSASAAKRFLGKALRGCKGTFHKMSPKRLHRYVDEFAGKHNIRDSGTLAQMRDTVARLVGRRLMHRDLIADNGLSSGSGA